MRYDHFFEANRNAWNLRTNAHKGSAFYDVQGWRKHKNSLMPIEIRELGGDIPGKTLLHLQCHFGQDTLSWAHRGAVVTGCDFSEQAIQFARELADSEQIPATFICCNVYDLPDHLQGQFDVVFTSYGTIGWLPDLDRWAAVVAHFLKPGGTFYIADFHPVVWMLDEQMQYLKYPYAGGEVIISENTGTYADTQADIQYTDYSWNHSLSEIVNSLINNGLQIEFLNEHPYSPYDCFPNTVRGDDGFYRIKGLENIIPMLYSIKARKKST
jgi:2-polyprenyl-3-methyl-5-hydroxy-6-metoxy-1,4-benzoquinol methylase